MKTPSVCRLTVAWLLQEFNTPLASIDNTPPKERDEGITDILEDTFKRGAYDTLQPFHLLLAIRPIYKKPPLRLEAADKVSVLAGGNVFECQERIRECERGQRTEKGGHRRPLQHPRTMRRVAVLESDVRPSGELPQRSSQRYPDLLPPPIATPSSYNARMHTTIFALLAMGGRLLHCPSSLDQWEIPPEYRQSFVRFVFLHLWGPSSRPRSQCYSFGHRFQPPQPSAKRPGGIGLVVRLAH